MVKMSSKMLRHLPLLKENNKIIIFFQFIIMCNFGFLRVDSLVFVDMQQSPTVEKTKLLKMKKKY